MTLLDRLLNIEDPKIPVHEFTAALAEYKRGYATKPGIVTAFELSAGEATALQAFLDNLDLDTINRDLIEDVLLLGESGIYSMVHVEARLGI